MKRLRINTILKVSFIASLILPLLFTSTACMTPSESDIIEGILQNVDALNGEMTIVTKDGETITIKITTETPEDEESSELSDLEVGSVVKVEADKVTQVEKEDIEYEDKDTEKEPSTNVDLSSILPPLESIEDVFRALGVWEDAVELREIGLSWAHVARELGYGEDKMHIQLQDIAEERLKAAKESGLISQEQLEYKFNYFNELALKWINKIFADDI